MVSGPNPLVATIFYPHKSLAYSPAIDISTCGDSEEQARKRFIEAAAIFFEEITRMGTVDEVLSECGWTQKNISSCWKKLKNLHRIFTAAVI